MKKLLYISLLFVCFLSGVVAQVEVSGLVLDSDFEEPLIGGTVQIKGTERGTTTNLEGRYSFVLQKGNYTFIFNYIGMKTAELAVVVTEKKEIKLPNVAMKSATVIGETIIVTEGKYAKKLEESTVSVDVITAQTIANNNATSLDQVINKTSGVKIMDNQVSIRAGSGYAYGVGSRVAFLVDGQPLLSAELSDVKWNMLPIENAEQIEVIKGAASVLYGSGALNGVINLRTAYPKGNKPYTAFSMYVGVYDQPKTKAMRWFKPQDKLAKQPMLIGLYFAHRQKLHKNFDLVLGGNFHLENGYIKDMNERRFRFNFATRYRPPNANGRISYGINGNMMYHRQGTFFLAKDMTEGAYTNISPLYADKYGSITLDPYLTIYDKQGSKHDLRGRWFNIAKHQEGPDSDAHIFSLEYQFQKKFNNEWVFTAGVLGQYFNVNSILFADANAASNERALFTGQSVGVYAQVDKKFWDRLSITLGTRWENFWVSHRFISAPPIFRLGANLKVSQFDFLRASFGQGFRVPSFGEMFINEPIPLDGPLSLGIYPNPDLKPERGWTAELAYRRNFSFGKFSFYLDFALFLMEYHDMIEAALGSYPQGVGFRFNNISYARIAGGELSLQTKGKIGKFPLRIWGGYTYSFPGDLTADTSLVNVGNYLNMLGDIFVNGVKGGNQFSLLKYRSLHNFRMDIETEYKGITLGFAANYSSFVQKIDDIFSFGFVTKGLPAFRKAHNKGAWVFDLRLGYQINSKQRINLVIRNLLNEEYASRPARMGAPRSFSLKYSHLF